MQLFPVEFSTQHAVVAGVSKKHRERWRKDTIWAWRDSMEFFLIRHYRQCLPILREYDLVGERQEEETPGLSG
jgi:hypothetical protein